MQPTTVDDKQWCVHWPAVKAAELPPRVLHYAGHAGWQTGWHRPRTTPGTCQLAGPRGSLISGWAHHAPYLPGNRHIQTNIWTVFNKEVDSLGTQKHVYIWTLFNNEVDYVYIWTWFNDEVDSLHTQKHVYIWTLFNNEVDSLGTQKHVYIWTLFNKAVDSFSTQKHAYIWTLFNKAVDSLGTQKHVYIWTLFNKAVVHRNMYTFGHCLTKLWILQVHIIAEVHKLGNIISA